MTESATLVHKGLQETVLQMSNVSGSAMTVLELATGALKFGTLSEREQQVAALVCNCLSNKEIARELDLCEGTIKQHLRNTYRKLGIGNRSALIAALLDPQKSKAR